MGTTDNSCSESQSRLQPLQGDAVAAGPSPSATLRAVLTYRTCDRLSEGLIYFMVVFTPWVFGTTIVWSVWAMNTCGFLLGILLCVKWAIRVCYGFRPQRWQTDPEESALSQGESRIEASKWGTLGLAALTVAILCYCLIAAINARATYDNVRLDFAYHNYIHWLPHSYDSGRSWRFFFDALALAGFFWATWDWLLGKTVSEERAARNQAEDIGSRLLMPARLRRLLWVSSINATLVGVEGISQRLSGTNKLLWIKETRINNAAEYQFGPYAYRSNAAQYLNLVWPATLGLWWALWRRNWRTARAARSSGRGHRHHWLLPCVIIMAACPIISSSRASALVAGGMMMVAVVMLLMGLRRHHPSVKFGIVLLFAAAFAVGAYFGWDKFDERMHDFGIDMRGRERIYQTAEKIAQDYPVYWHRAGNISAGFSTLPILRRRILAGATSQRLAGGANHVRVGWRFAHCGGFLAGCSTMVFARRHSKRMAICVIAVVGVGRMFAASAFRLSAANIFHPASLFAAVCHTILSVKASGSDLMPRADLDWISNDIRNTLPDNVNLVINYRRFWKNNAIEKMNVIRNFRTFGGRNSRKNLAT